MLLNTHPSGYFATWQAIRILLNTTPPRSFPNTAAPQNPHWHESSSKSFWTQQPLRILPNMAAPQSLLNTVAPQNAYQHAMPQNYSQQNSPWDTFQYSPQNPSQHGAPQKLLNMTLSQILNPAPSQKPSKNSRPSNPQHDSSQNSS